jgi:molybdopterin/thiamine biosynthesis adenylyltransferase
MSVAQCLDQAQLVLEKLLFDPSSRLDDLRGEFEVYWLQTGNDTRPVLLGSLPEDCGRTTFWRLGKKENALRLLGNDRKEVEQLAVALGEDTVGTTEAPCWVIETIHWPAIPEQMPTTVLELFKWLRQWDRAVYDAVQRTLGSEPDYLKYNSVTFAVRSPAGWLGFGIDLDSHARVFSRRGGKVFRNYLHNLGGGTKIFRLRIVDVSPSFVHSRNLTHPDLRDKNIVVVGCGAIGSHVAQALTRLGAGTGKGRLLLIDNEILMPENLGRHALGYPALFHNKAEALASDLKREFPLARIDASPESVTELPSLFDAQLVINATGEEALSEALNRRHLDEAPSVPLLHAWILGNGEAVQALWVGGRKDACFRCLRIIGPDGKLDYRFPVLKGDVQLQQRGCRAFTPYAISAPLQAAALVSEMIVDWLSSKDPSPRFRTRPSENADVHAVKNQDVTPAEHCMACGRDL